MEYLVKEATETNKNFNIKNHADKKILRKINHPYKKMLKAIFFFYKNAHFYNSIILHYS